MLDRRMRFLIVKLPRFSGWKITSAVMRFPLVMPRLGAAAVLCDQVASGG
jgi:hypothetical protein